MQRRTKKIDKTNVVFVIDASGSMHPFRENVLDSFAKLSETIPVGSEKKYIVFNNRNNIKELDGFIPEYYNTSGGTALYDAVKVALEYDDGVTPLLVVVLTDGEENCSQTKAWTLAGEIESLQKTDRLTLTFMVPRGYKQKLVSNLKVPAGNIEEWDTTDVGYARASIQTANSTSSYFQARAAGKTSLSTFYSNADNIKPAALQSSLMNITGKVAVWTVPAECEIKEFVEEKTGKNYVPGMAFYQLTKPEKVQAYKDFAIMEKGKKQVFSGPNVRNVLGLPYTDAKVIPGNHANYNVFVTSRSVNRKLVRGTQVIAFK